MRKKTSECVGEKANVEKTKGRKDLIIQNKIHKFNTTWKTVQVKKFEKQKTVVLGESEFEGNKEDTSQKNCDLQGEQFKYKAHQSSCQRTEEGFRALAIQDTSEQSRSSLYDSN